MKRFAVGFAAWVTFGQLSWLAAKLEWTFGPFDLERLFFTGQVVALAWGVYLMDFRKAREGSAGDE